jgi:two-component system response regulator YesN
VLEVGKTTTNRLTEVFEEKTLKRILSCFTEATGIPAYIVDLRGRVLLDNEALSHTAFCQLVRNGQKGSRKCTESYARAGKYAAKFGVPYIFRCPAGLVCWAAPLMMGAHQVGSIICGQVLMWEPEEFFWEEVDEVATKFGVEPGQLQVAVRNLEVISTTRVQAAAELLFTFADSIMRTGLMVLEQRRCMNKLQADLADKILQRKAANVEARDSLGYPLKAEREVLVRLRLRDGQGAREAMEAFLMDAIQLGGSVRRLKVRFTELLVQISRAALEAGVDPDTALEIGGQHLERMMTMASPEEMCYCAQAALEACLDCLGRENLPASVVLKAQNHIQRHFCHLTSVREVADAVNLTPDYLGRLFREQLGCSISAYITRVRIEEAKRLLRETRLTVSAISSKVGYSDPNYFTKVFKKVEQTTPGFYRNTGPKEKVSPQQTLRRSAKAPKARGDLSTLLSHRA